jgi:hypothetical protein
MGKKRTKAEIKRRAKNLLSTGSVVLECGGSLEKFQRLVVDAASDEGWGLTDITSLLLEFDSLMQEQMREE